MKEGKGVKAERVGGEREGDCTDKFNDQTEWQRKRKMDAPSCCPNS